VLDSQPVDSRLASAAQAGENIPDSLNTIIPHFDRLENAAVTAEPYPHFIVPGFLEAGDVRRLLRDFPALDMPGLFVPTNVSGSLAGLIAQLESRRMRDIISRKLDVDLTSSTTLVTLRDRCKGSDGQIHADAKFKLATALLYLNDGWQSSEGRLRVLRSATDIEDFVVEIPPEGGLLACFRVQHNSWHGHKPFVGKRRYLMLNYCDRRFVREREALRHLLSGRVKRLAQAFQRKQRP
jgi:hypothetical protein